MLLEAAQQKQKKTQKRERSEALAVKHIYLVLQMKQRPHNTLLN